MQPRTQARPGHGMVEDRADTRGQAGQLPPVMTINAEGRSPFVLVCDHASNRIPATLWRSGPDASAQRLMHIAWDPGALAVSHGLVDLLDAPLVHSTVSRLVIDCNRDIEFARTDLDAVGRHDDRRQYRRSAKRSGSGGSTTITRPFHAAIEALLDWREARGAGRLSSIAMHSFTPVYLGVARPWPIGLIHGRRHQLYQGGVRRAQGARTPSLDVGWNQPYAALNGVTLTLEKHGDGRGLDACMIEIRNDEILEPAGVALWAGRLARCLEAARRTRGRAMAS